MTEDDDPKFAKAAKNMGLKIVLITRLSNEEIESKKLNYLDIGKINVVVEPDKKLIKKIKNSSDLFYKSNKVIMSDKKRYSSYPKYKKDIACNGNFEPLDSSSRFFDDLDHYHIVKLLD